MTEGNIASWKVKEGTNLTRLWLTLGDSFSTGDVLLEIETDKAQMDVEAQDDGIVAKITEQDGAKAVQVGKRIAVMAEPGDDLSSLEIPPEDNPKLQSSPKSEKSSEPEKQSAASESKPEKEPAKQTESNDKPSKSTGKTSKYPLYPSVEHLLHEHNISHSDVSKIKATGPSGRLLKGDVLAYVGKIDKSYSADQSKKIAKRGHLDLSNIKLAKPKPAEPKKDDRAAPKEIPPTEIAVPVSFAAVFATQKRIQESLGLTLPLSTFISRASEIANQALPQAKGSPTSDELFDAVLGISRTGPKTARGSYVPQITTLPARSQTLNIADKPRPLDVYDILAGKKPVSATTAPPRRSAGALGVGAADNVFSLVVKPGEERRARTYLERVKTVLEAEPGRCVL